MTAPRCPPGDRIALLVSDVDGTLVTDAKELTAGSNQEEGFAAAVERFVLDRAAPREAVP